MSCSTGMRFRWKGRGPYLCKNHNLALLVLRKSRVKRLQQRPYVVCRRLRVVDRAFSVREAHSNRLVDVEHIRDLVEAIRIQDRGVRISPDGKMAGSVLLEQADHAGAPRSAIEPSR